MSGHSWEEGCHCHQMGWGRRLCYPSCNILLVRHDLLPINNHCPLVFIWSVETLCPRLSLTGKGFLTAWCPSRWSHAPLPRLVITLTLVLRIYLSPSPFRMRIFGNRGFSCVPFNSNSQHGSLYCVCIVGTFVSEWKSHTQKRCSCDTFFLESLSFPILSYFNPCPFSTVRKGIL